jgi:D-arabinose 1-dehydrogenase-like Zn-dependent alcohol dehydrogenase
MLRRHRCMVDSDRTCPECRAGLEQFCPNMTLTYNSPDKHLGASPAAGIRPASPMSYAMDGAQYVAIAAGRDLFSFGLP